MPNATRRSSWVALAVAMMLVVPVGRASVSAYTFSSPAFHEDKGAICIGQPGSGLFGRIYIQRPNIRAINATTSYDTQTVRLGYVVMRWGGNDVGWYPYTYGPWRWGPIHQVGEDSWTSLAQTGGPVGDLTGDVVDIEHSGYYQAAIAYTWHARPEIGLAYAEHLAYVEWHYGPYFTNPASYCTF